MDTIYGSLITIVPIVVITTLNILIGRRLRRARQVALRLQRVCAEESRLRLEFTGILLFVSTTFISLNHAISAGTDVEQGQSFEIQTKTETKVLAFRSKSTSQFWL